MSEEQVVKEWLPEEYREDPSFQNYKDLGSVLKTFKNQESMIGTRIKPPSDDMSDDDWNDFVSKVRPKDKSAYGIEGLDEQLVDSFHELGLPTRQARGLADKLKALNETVTSSRAAKDAEQKQKAFDSLVEEYGSEDAANEVLIGVKGLIDKTIGSKYPDFLEFMDNATVKVGDEEIALANHPVMAKALKVVLDMTTDDNKDIQGDSVNPETLNEQWLEVLGEMTRSEFSPGQAEYDKLVKKKKDLEAAMSKLQS